MSVSFVWAGGEKGQKCKTNQEKRSKIELKKKVTEKKTGREKQIGRETKITRDSYSITMLSLLSLCKRLLQS